MVVVVLFITGLQLPVTPLLEVVGKADKVSPLQLGETWVNVGMTVGFTMICMVCVLEHCPAYGEKVYVVVVVLLIAGLQVPVTPLSEVVGRADIVSPLQTGAT